MNLYVGEQENGGIVIARVGDQITIALPEIPTSGYRWQTSVHGDAVAVAATEYVRASDAVGGGGDRQLIFIATREGASTVHAHLQRPWEQTPLRDYAVTIRVEAT